MPIENIKIAGAGPAGLTAAINLAKAGYQVEVFEKNHDTGVRFHGDLQGLENWSRERDIIDELHDMNIKSTNFNYNGFKNLRISNGTKNWDFSCEEPVFYLVRRGNIEGSLDHGLKKQAVDSGVNLHFKTNPPVDTINIIATGPIKNEVYIIAKGKTFETDADDTALGIVDNHAAFNGYSYLLISQGYGCLCTVLFDRFKDASKCFEKTEKIISSQVDFNIQNPKKMAGLGSFSNKNIFKQNEKLYIGEAAGLQDLFWGFGMGNAITSGFLAAESIINGTDYAKTAENYFKKKLKASIVNRYIWEKVGSKDYSFIVNRIHNSTDSIKYLRSFYNFNILQKIIYPFSMHYMKKRYPNLRL
jgi:flavin-dependent dehydrogenase